MLYCPTCKGPLIERDEYLLCTLCCASFRRTSEGIRFFRQFTGNKHVKEFLEVFQHEMYGVKEEGEAENDSRGEEGVESVDNSVYGASNENES